MINNKLNLFEYATKELSQDAILLYLADCFNDKEKKQIGKKFLKTFYGNIDGLKKVYSIKQYHHIDVLIVLEFADKLDFLIIEDKVYSSEHSNQLERYKNEISEGDFNYFGIPSKSKGNIVPIYFKPVLYDDNEKIIAVEKNEYIYKGYSDLLQVLNIAVEDTILNLFKEFFEARFKKDNEIVLAKNLSALTKQFSVSDIMDSSCGQWILLKLLMQDLDKEYLSGKQYNGSSYGRPWTQYRFVVDKDSKQENWSNLNLNGVVRGKYSYFFRLDWEKKGYYISINQYIGDKNKANEDKKNERKILAEQLGTKYQSNNYKESKVFVVYFDSWEKLESQKEALKNAMCAISEYNQKKYN